MLTDTHAHLDFPDFAADLDAVVARAQRAGVERIITIGTTLESSRRAIEIAERYPQVYATVGVHPGNAEEAPQDFAETLRELARHPKVVAIGETGLDYYRLPSKELGKSMSGMEVLETLPGEPEAAIRDGAIKAAQAAVFCEQLDLAVEFGLNVVIHQRDSWEDTLEMLASYEGKLRCVFHCFGGAPEQAAELAAQGHLVSFTGIVTFKNAADAQASAASVAADGFMVETDCPYLAPAPHRGKRCEPAYTRLVAEQVAALRNSTLEAIAYATETTANAFFRFDRGRV